MADSPKDGGAAAYIAKVNASADDAKAGKSDSGGGGLSKGKLAGLIVTGVIMIICLSLQQYYWNKVAEDKQKYNNTDAGKAEIAIEAVKAETDLVLAQARKARAEGKSLPAQPLQAQAPASPVQSSVRVVEDIKDGDVVMLPENARIILQGPMSFAMANSLQRIKGYKGDFKLHVEESENYSWTSGFSPQSPALSMDVFLSKFRDLQQRKPIDNRVRMFINNGVVEINT